MTETPTTFYCVNHPSTETSLRCNNCEDPICPKCAVLTPTGYRCRKCVRSQQKKFDTSEWYDYPLAFIISTMIAFLGSLIVPFVNFFILFIAPIVGIAIAEAIRFVTRKRRSNLLLTIATVGTVIGCLPALIGPLLSLFTGAGINVFGVVWAGYYIFSVTSSEFYRLKGINIR